MKVEYFNFRSFKHEAGIIKTSTEVLESMADRPYQEISVFSGYKCKLCHSHDIVKIGESNRYVLECNDCGNWEEVESFPVVFDIIG